MQGARSRSSFRTGITISTRGLCGPLYGCGGSGSAALSKESRNLMPATIGGRTAHRLERG